MNPRASRTVPFVSKAIGVPLAKLATKVMLGQTLRDLGLTQEREVKHIAIKEAVFPFIKFPGVDAVLGPEMKSTGEVMGIDRDFRKAYVKSQLAAGAPLPTSGKVFLSVKNRDKRALLSIAKRLSEMGFSLVATAGTAKLLARQGMEVETIHKVAEGYRPNVVDLMKRGDIALVFNTPGGRARAKGLLAHPAHGGDAEHSLLHDGGRRPGGGRRHRGAAQGRDRRPFAPGVPCQLIPGTGSSSPSTSTRSKPRSRLVERLDGIVTRFKIGSQLFTAAGPAAVEAVRKRGGRGVPRSQVPRHPQYRGRRGARGRASRRVHVQRPRLRRPSP